MWTWQYAYEMTENVLNVLHEMEMEMENEFLK